MSDGYEERWDPPGGPPCSEGLYQQACDVRRDFKPQNATADAEDTSCRAGGRPANKPRRGGWVLAVLGLCAVVGLVVFTLVHGAGNGAMLVSMKNKLEMYGRALEDLMFALKTSKRSGHAIPDKSTFVTTTPSTTNASRPEQHYGLTDMTITERVTPNVTDTAADDIITQKVEEITHQPLRVTTSNKEQISDCDWWTPWFDRDDPTGTADVESLADLRSENPGQICAEPSAVHARVIATQMEANLTGEIFIYYDTTNGFVCRKVDQPDNGCLDYEVRFCCPPSPNAGDFGKKHAGVPLGMESGAIPDASITASSSWGEQHEAFRARLNGDAGVGAWAARRNTVGQWLKVDLGKVMQVTGTIIQGRKHYDDQWVTSYKLHYSTDGATWTTYKGSNGSDNVFPGNTDRNTPVTNLLDRPVSARYVRFVIQSWHGHISMRTEVLGLPAKDVLPTVVGYSVRRGDCPGNDIWSLFGNEITLQMCARRCDGHPNCVAFMFHDNKRCFPKSNTCKDTTKDNPKNVFYDKESVCKIKATDTTYRYRWDLPPVTSSTFRFEAAATNDVHIALSTENHDVEHMYEVVIGGWWNTKSVIRREKQGTAMTYRLTFGILSRSHFRAFSISWTPDGVITVRKDAGIALLTWKDPNPLPIRHVGYSTGWNGKGLWKFCSKDPAEREPKGLWHLNRKFGAKDLTGNGNDGKLQETAFTNGPTGQAAGSSYFMGKSSSVLEIGNNGALDIPYSITILAHVRPTASDVPLYGFMTDTWGLLRPWQSTAANMRRCTDTSGRNVPNDGPGKVWSTWCKEKNMRTQTAIPKLVPNTWNYIGVSYNYSSGEVSLWSNSVKVASHNIGSIESRAHFPLVVRLRTSSRKVPGQVSCLQVYDYAMTTSQIRAARDKCTGHTCPNGWTQLGTLCFKHVKQEANWEDADQVCKDMGASLHTASTLGEFQHVEHLVPMDTTRWVWANRGQNMQKNVCRATFIPRVYKSGRRPPKAILIRPCYRKATFLCKKA